MVPVLGGEVEEGRQRFLLLRLLIGAATMQRRFASVAVLASKSACLPRLLIVNGTNGPGSANTSSRTSVSLAHAQVPWGRASVTMALPANRAPDRNSRSRSHNFAHSSKR